MPLSDYTEPSTVSSSDTLAATDHNSEIVESIKHLKGVNDSHTVILHREAVGVAAGTATATTWNVRPLTSILANTNAAGLVSIDTVNNRFTLQAGVWRLNVKCAAFYTTLTWLRLYNVTDAGEQTGFFSIAQTVGGSEAQNIHGSGIIKITASKTFELQMYCTRTQASSGMGNPTSVSTETYLIGELECIDKD